MAEAAIALSLLVLLVLSIVDVALLVGIEMALEHGVTQASRYGATGRTRVGLTREASILAELRDALPSLTIAPADVTFTNLTRAAGVGAGGPTDVVVLSVVHQWRLVSPLLQPFFDQGVATVRASAAVADEPFPTRAS